MMKFMKYVCCGKKQATPRVRRAMSQPLLHGMASSSTEVTEADAAGAAGRVKKMRIDPEEVYVSTTGTNYQGKYHTRKNCSGLKAAKMVYKKDASLLCCNIKEVHE